MALRYTYARALFSTFYFTFYFYRLYAFKRFSPKQKSRIAVPSAAARDLPFSILQKLLAEKQCALLRVRCENKRLRHLITRQHCWLTSHYAIRQRGHKVRVNARNRHE